MSDYQSLESSIVSVMEAQKRPAVKKEAEHDKAKDDSMPSKKDGGDEDDGQDRTLTGQETQPDVSMPIPNQTKTDKDIAKDTGNAPEGKADKVVVYPKIGESLTFSEADHRVGDTVYYNSGASDHLKRGTIKLATPTHFHVRRGKYLYHVPKASVVHNDRLHESASFKSERPHAAKGFMSPSMAAQMKVGMNADYYRHHTGDKTSGRVIHNDGKRISFYNDAGAVHHYTIKPHDDVQEGLAMQPNLTPDRGQPGRALPTSESTGSMRKVGDIVKPKIGPHAGHPHRVIHVFPDGKMNIQPVRMHPRRVQYRLGAAGAYEKDVE